MITNRFKIVGTAVTPFIKTIKNSFTSYKMYVETCKYNYTQCIPITLYEKKNLKQVYDFTKDLTGKQVAISGYIQANCYKTQDGRWIDNVYIVGRQLCVISSPTKEEKKHMSVEEEGLYLDEFDLPI